MEFGTSSPTDQRASIGRLKNIFLWSSQRAHGQTCCDTKAKVSTKKKICVTVFCGLIKSIVFVSLVGDKHFQAVSNSGYHDSERPALL